ncbi:MAG: MFS transporter, partial [Mesorhizobium sp.]|uniref:MFS transporter n=1 Tax=Mesorhizobium sp. TaxID=1871066 RepID=UPI000FEA1B43
SVALGQAWRISPVGVVGMLAVGGLSMIISGFAPIHATAKRYSQAEVALLLSAMPVGTLILQIPLGWLSDRTDRRYVLAVAASLLAIAFDGGALMALVAIYLIWDGASESIYSLSSAHAADRARKEELLALSSSLLFAWSLSGFIVPGIVTALSAVFGTETFIYVGIAIASAFCLFVLWRVFAARPMPAAATGSFAPMSAQTPLPVELAFASEEPTKPAKD